MSNYGKSVNNLFYTSSCLFVKNNNSMREFVSQKIFHCKPNLAKSRNLYGTSCVDNPPPKGLSREVALEKVPRPANQRPVFCLPYDPRLPGIAKILRKRHQALLSRDVDAREYFPEPPLVTYTRTKNLRDLVFRAQVPKLMLRRGLRPARPPGFFKCGRRSNCALCLHSENATTYTCPVSGATAKITQHITCQSAGV